LSFNKFSQTISWIWRRKRRGAREGSEEESGNAREDRGKEKEGG